MRTVQERRCSPGYCTRVAYTSVRKNELMPAQADNPDGFWEHLGFVALNDELLNALGGAWDLPPKLRRISAPPLDPLRMKARLLMEQVSIRQSSGAGRIRATV